MTRIWRGSSTRYSISASTNHDLRLSDGVRIRISRCVESGKRRIMLLKNL